MGILEKQVSWDKWWSNFPGLNFRFTWMSRKISGVTTLFGWQFFLFAMHPSFKSLYIQLLIMWFDVMWFVFSGKIVNKICITQYWILPCFSTTQGKLTADWSCTKRETMDVLSRLLCRQVVFTLYSNSLCTDCRLTKGLLAQNARSCMFQITCERTEDMPHQQPTEIWQKKTIK